MTKEEIESINFTSPSTTEEWDAAIQEAGFHIKWHNEVERPEKYPFSQLEHMSNNFADKISFLDMFIDAEAETVSDLVDPTPEEELAIANVNKYFRLKKFKALIDKEIELREAETVTRSPIGTVYYVDIDNGDNAADGLTSTGDATNGPWAHINQFITNGRSPGDICYVRRSSTAMSNASITAPVSDGTFDNPIIVSADFTDIWGDFANSAQTYTVVKGAKSWTASATITGITAGDWIYVTGDDAELHCLEVESVSGTTINFFNYYKGDQSGSGKTIVVMGPNPVHGTGTSNDLLYHLGDTNWIYSGIDSNSAQTNGNFYWDNSNGEVRNSHGNSSGTRGGYIANNALVRFSNCTYEKSAGSFSVVLTNDVSQGVWDNCSFFGTSTAQCFNFADDGGYHFLSDVHIEGYTDGINVSAAETKTSVFGRNVTFTTVTNPVQVDTNGVDVHAVQIEDYNGTLGDCRIWGGKGSTSTAPYIQTDAVTVRSGGSSVSLKFTPSDYQGRWVDGALVLIGNTLNQVVTSGIPIQCAASATTVTLYLKPDDTADWTADPTAAELYLEVEYLGSGSNCSRSIKRSTGVVDFNGSSDWQSISVSFTPAQAGIAYLKALYLKPKESGNNNIFYFDPIPVIS